MQRNNNPLDRQRGSALLMILMAVALFAALAFTFSRGMQQGGENLGARRAGLAASDILAYSAKTDRILNHMLQNDLSESDVNFDGLSGTYTNTTCPATEKCKVFSPQGGGLEPLYPLPDWLDKNFSADAFYGTWFVTARICVTAIGTDACVGSSGTELTMVLPYLQESICAAINEKLGITGAIPVLAAIGGIDNPGRFDGSFAPAGPVLLNNAAINGHYTACIFDDSIDAYLFYQVLIAR